MAEEELPLSPLKWAEARDPKRDEILKNLVILMRGAADAVYKQIEGILTGDDFVEAGPPVEMLEGEEDEERMIKEQEALDLFTSLPQEQREEATVYIHDKLELSSTKLDLRELSDERLDKLLVYIKAFQGGGKRGLESDDDDYFQGKQKRRKKRKVE
eukprot:TRINITY_DN47162_c0_g1_i1.p1 TRINITY_DN47162_c0_g1~~TRINITY_DN47162_c0_g1_i1.p1  ORF type:complete len:157 (+),score=61.32 TRINITY_DN47162_c0_g1_i1:435-905(+)